MNKSDSTPSDQQLDEETSRRLGKLRAKPMDISVLRRAVDAEVRPGPVGLRIGGGGLTPLRAVAAALLLLASVIALVLHSSSGPALASPDKLSRVHESVLAAPRTDAHIDSANAALRAAYAGAPRVPEVSGQRVRSCCMRSLSGKRISCVALESDGVPVTLAVADAAEIDLPASRAENVGGVLYLTQSAGPVNMLMAERQGRFVCLMGRVPIPRLVEVAQSLQF